MHVYTIVTNATSLKIHCSWNAAILRHGFNQRRGKSPSVLALSFFLHRVLLFFNFISEQQSDYADRPNPSLGSSKLGKTTENARPLAFVKIYEGEKNYFEWIKGKNIKQIEKTTYLFNTRISIPLEKNIHSKVAWRNTFEYVYANNRKPLEKDFYYIESSGFLWTNYIHIP